MDILITNNPLVDEEYRGRFTVEFHETSALGILVSTRDRIHSGHRLLTHPLSGSLKPNETPYKSVLVSEICAGADPKSVHIIEECILVAQKFTTKEVSEHHLQDLRIIDLSLIRPALETHRKLYLED